VCEDRKQPALGIGAPSVKNRDQGDSSCNRRRFAAWRRLDRLQLAAFSAVDDVPPALTQFVPDRVGGGEVAGSPALDAFVEESLSFASIRSFWL
jgi:hypothetical protein